MLSALFYVKHTWDFVRITILFLVVLSLSFIATLYIRLIWNLIKKLAVQPIYMYIPPVPFLNLTLPWTDPRILLSQGDWLWFSYLLLTRMCRHRWYIPPEHHEQRHTASAINRAGITGWLNIMIVFTSVCTIRILFFLISQINSYTFKLLSHFILSNILSSTMNVPVRPTPALQCTRSVGPLYGWVFLTLLMNWIMHVLSAGTPWSGQTVKW